MNCYSVKAIYFPEVPYSIRQKNKYVFASSFVGMRAKVDSEQNITSAILHPSHSPAQLIPGREGPASANQKPGRGLSDQ